MLGSSLYRTVSNPFFGTLPRIRVNSFRKKNKETVVQSSYIRMLFNFKLFAIKNISLHLEAEKGGLFYLVFSYHKGKMLPSVRRYMEERFKLFALSITTVKNLTRTSYKKQQLATQVAQPFASDEQYGQAMRSKAELATRTRP